MRLLGLLPDLQKLRKADQETFELKWYTDDNVFSFLSHFFSKKESLQRHRKYLEGTVQK